ncbi:hypothetical protein OG625_25900 [Streptomyces sp. NBC_01351]|uniref:hypothetical protein n=1 Tax=Streptomyces sp. NBC_01351 TaxID=2903833 RepID=UPI002E2EC0C2|nr:hypothetical protein [Streptomyces sp. NBC_01351]
MITGDDHVFVVHGPPAPAIARFLASWAEDRPGLRVAFVGGDGFHPWAPAGLELPEEAAELLVARDESMPGWWDDHGYRLDGSGEGPFSVLYEKASWESLRVTAMEDPYGDEGFRHTPYDVRLLGAGFSLVTVVTPGPGGFSDALLARIREAFTGPSPRFDPADPAP